MNTYWANTGRHQALADRLQTLIPIEGPVANTRTNPKLERFRKAANCYYDLYNNGLFNRASEFRTVFGIASSNYRTADRKWFTNELFTLTEAAMDTIVLEAAAEQNIRTLTDAERVAYDAQVDGIRKFVARYFGSLRSDLNRVQQQTTVVVGGAKAPQPIPGTLLDELVRMCQPIAGQQAIPYATAMIVEYAMERPA